MPTAYVLMPFGDDFDDVFSGLIKPALEGAGFEVSRADLSLNQRQILKDIIDGISSADLIVADLSGLNANVMYELGLSHAMGRRVIMITRSIDELPFDLQAYRANEYSVHFAEAPALIARINEIAVSVTEGNGDFSNPVQDFAPDFLGKQEQVSASPARSADSANATDLGNDSGDAVSEVPSLGLLDYVVMLNEAAAEVVTVTEAISGATESVGLKIEARGEQITRTQKNLGERAAPVLRKIMQDSAIEFDEFAEVVEAENPKLASAFTAMGKAANGLARIRANVTNEERQQIQDEIDSLLAAEAASEGSYTSTSNFAQTLSDLPNTEHTMKGASTRAATAVAETAEIIRLSRAEFARARGLLEERLQ
jgi:hypothetical protein